MIFSFVIHADCPFLVFKYLMVTSTSQEENEHIHRDKKLMKRGVEYEGAFVWENPNSDQSRIQKTDSAERST